MAALLVCDELWPLIEPLIPPQAVKSKGGQPSVPNRAVLAGIPFILKSGIIGMLPQVMGCGSGMTYSAVCGTGSRSVSGSACTTSCLTGWAKLGAFFGLAVD